MWLFLWLVSAWADPTALLQAGDYVAAEQEARTLLETDLEPSYRGYYLTALAAAVGGQGRHEEGLALSEQALTVYIGALGPDDHNLLQLYLNLARQRLGAGNVVGCRAALAEMERLWAVNGVSPEDLPRYRAQLAHQQLEMGDAEGALTRIERALLEVSTPEWRATCQRTRALALETVGRRDEALVQWHQLVAHAAEHAPGSAPHVEMLLSAAELEEGPELDALLEQAQTLLAAMPEGPERAELGEWLLRLQGAVALGDELLREQARLISLVEQAAYAEAIEHGQALSLRFDELLGPDDIHTQQVRAEWAAALVELGRYDEALAALAPLSQSRHTEMAIRGDGERARILQLQGQHAQARPLLEATVARAEQALGDVASTQVLRTNLAQLRYEMGDALGALQGFRKAEVWYRVHAPGDWASRSSLANNLGLALNALGDMQGAYDAWTLAMELPRTHVSDAHPLVVYPANHLSQLCTRQYRMNGGKEWRDAALQLSGFVLEARRKQLGERHPSTQIAWNNRGLALSAAGRTDEARTAFERALDGELGARHPERAVFLENLAYTFLVDDSDRALELAREALSIYFEQLDLVQDQVSERERLFARDAYERALSLVIGLEPSAQRAWAEVLVAKGLSARTLVAQRRVRESDPELLSLEDQLRDTRQQLSTAVLSGGELEALTAAKESLEGELARRSAGWRSQQAAASPAPQDICAALERGQVLVDWITWSKDTVVDGRLEAHLEVSAFVVDRSCTVERVDLGPAAESGALAERWRTMLSDPAASTDRIDRLGSRVREAWWDPLAPLVGDARSLVLSPGVLETLPWNALPLQDGYLVERWPTALVSDAGELLRARHRPDRGAVVVGAVDYEAQVHPQSLGQRAAPCSDEPFVPLPATAGEAREVARLLGTTPILGAEATVEAVSARLGNARTVHLSTHGYFADPTRCAEVETGPDARVLWSPMVLSGLAMAGANVRAEGTDGIWTAEEVAGLDLRGTQLVVLSACETNLGMSFGQEGLMGLRRAFSMAGARNLVTTLWQVEDTATRRLMEAFYARPPGKPVAERLRDAQLAELAWQRANRGEAHPQAWAAFVAAGPWR